MKDIGKISDGDASKSKKSLEREGRSTDSKSHKLLDDIIRSKLFNNTSQEETDKFHTWSASIAEKKGAFKEVEKVYANKKIISDFIEKRKEIDNKLLYIKFKENEKQEIEASIAMSHRNVIVIFTDNTSKFASSLEYYAQLALEKKETYHNNLSKHTKVIDHLKSTIEQKRTEIAEFTASKESLLADISRLIKEKEKLGTQCEQLEKKYMKLEEKYQDTKTKGENIQTRIANLNQEIATREGLQKDLEKELQQKLALSKRKQVSVIADESTSSSLKIKFTEKREYLEEIKQDISKQEKLQMEFKKDLSMICLKAKLRPSKQFVEDWKDNIDRLATLKKEFEETNASILTLRKQIKSLENEKMPFGVDPKYNHLYEEEQLSLQSEITKEIETIESERKSKELSSEGIRKDLENLEKTISEMEESQSEGLSDLDLLNIKYAVIKKYDTANAKSLKAKLKSLQTQSTHLGHKKEEFEASIKSFQKEERTIKEYSYLFNEERYIKIRARSIKFHTRKPSIAQYQKFHDPYFDEKASTDEEVTILNNTISLIISKEKEHIVKINELKVNTDKLKKDISKLENLICPFKETNLNEEKAKLLDLFIRRKSEKEEEIDKIFEVSLQHSDEVARGRMKLIASREKIQSYQLQEIKLKEERYNNELLEYQKEINTIENNIDGKLLGIETNIQQKLSQLLNLQKEQEKELATLQEQLQNRKREELQEVANLTLQSNNLSSSIASISQALEGYRQELERSRTDLATTNREKEALEKQLEKTKKDFEERNEQLKAADTQLQQKLREHDTLAGCLTKPIEEQKQQEDCLAKAQEEMQFFKKKHNKYLKEIKNERKALNEDLNAQYQLSFQYHAQEISFLVDKLAKTDYELAKAHQELERAKNEERLAWKKVGALQEQQQTLIEVQDLPNELRDARAEVQNARRELQEAKREVAEEIIIQPLSNDEARASLAEAKVEAANNRKYIKPSYDEVMGKHRDFDSIYEPVRLEYKKNLETLESYIIQMNKELEDLVNKVRSKLRAIYLLDSIIIKTDQDIIGKSKDYKHKKCEYDEIKEICGKIQNKISSLDKEIYTLEEKEKSLQTSLIELNLRQEKQKTSISEGKKREFEQSSVFTLNGTIDNSHKEPQEMLTHPNLQLSDTTILQFALKGCEKELNNSREALVDTNKKKQLLETRFEQMKKLSEEAKKGIKDADTLLQQSRKERNDLNNSLNNLRQELIQEEQFLIEAKKNRELSINSCEKAKKAINNLDTFIESLRQISQGQI